MLFHRLQFRLHTSTPFVKIEVCILLMIYRMCIARVGVADIAKHCGCNQQGIQEANWDGWLNTYQPTWLRFFFPILRTVFLIK